MRKYVAEIKRTRYTGDAFVRSLSVLEWAHCRKRASLQKEKHGYPAAQTEHCVGVGVVCGIVRAVSATKTRAANLGIQEIGAQLRSETASERILIRALRFK